MRLAPIHSRISTWLSAIADASLHMTRTSATGVKARIWWLALSTNHYFLIARAAGM
jgi:hypothetical protein